MQLRVIGLVDWVALSCAVVSIVLGKGERTDFGLYKLGGESRCTPCSRKRGDGRIEVAERRGEVEGQESPAVLQRA